MQTPRFVLAVWNGIFGGRSVGLFDLYWYIVWERLDLPKESDDIMKPLH